MDSRELPAHQAASLLWDEYRFRHQIFWGSLFRWGAGIITLWILPYIRQDVVGKVRDVSIGPLAVIAIFPIAAFVFSVLAAIHLGFEYSRLDKVRRKYDEVLGSFRPDPESHSLFKRRVGVLIYCAFGVLFALISLVDLWVLARLPR